MPRVDAAYLESRRRQILDAALTCFARDGFHRTTVQDIVRETGLSAGAIYRYFPGKEDIVAAIAAERRTPATDVLERARDADDAVTALRDIVTASLTPLADPDEQRWRRVTVQVWAEALRDARVRDVLRAGYDEPVDVLADLVRRGQRQRMLPSGVDPVAAARVCASMFYGLVLQQALDPDVDVEAYVDTVLVVLDAISRPPPKRKLPAKRKPPAKVSAAARPARARRATPPRANPRGS